MGATEDARKPGGMEIDPPGDEEKVGASSPRACLPQGTEKRLVAGDLTLGDDPLPLR